MAPTSLIGSKVIHVSDPIETAELMAFTRTVDAKSLSRAAAELGVPRATLGRRLARLEERLAVRLLRRTTRSLSLTDAGEAFYRQARLALEAVALAEETVKHTDGPVRGAPRVTAPPIRSLDFHAMLCAFEERYPEVQLQVSFSTRRVDLLREGFDVALRAASDLEPGLVARTLLRDQLIAVASPAYLARHGKPTAARELTKHRCLAGFERGELPQTHWPLRRGGKVRIEPVMSSNELSLLRGAALAGLGIAMLPSFFIEPELESGELTRVLARELELATTLAIVYAERQFVPPQVRAFIDTVVAWSGEGLKPRPA